MGLTAGANAPLPDDLALQIATAQEVLREAAQTGPLRRDPYRVVLGAMSAAIGVFGKSVVRWERAVDDVIAARDPMPASERAELVAALVAATREGAEQGAFEATRKEARRMVRTIDRALATKIGLVVGCAFFCGASTMSLVWYAMASGPFDRAAVAGETWQQLVRDNPDPRPALEKSDARTDPSTGRPYYACVSFWKGPARPPPAGPVKP